MWSKSCKFLLVGVAVMLFSGVAAFAFNHHELNGTWQLVPSRSELNGEPAIQSGTVTINDREGNIYVDRSFNLDAANQSVTTNFSTDARAKASIKQAGFKSKAKWDGNVMKVVTTHDGMTTVERYSLAGDGTMVLQVERSGRPSETLYFERQ